METQPTSSNVVVLALRECNDLGKAPVERPGADRVTQTDSTAAVALAGELDLSNGNRLYEQLRLIIDAGATDLICDISALTYMDSTGLSIFLAAHKRHEGTGGHFIVLAPMPQVKRLFAVAGIEPFLDVRSNSS